MADWKGVHYSDNDVLRMQQEAIRRVRQMQQRSQQQLSGMQRQQPYTLSPGRGGSPHAAGRRDAATYEAPPQAKPDAQEQTPLKEEAPPQPQQQPAASGGPTPANGGGTHMGAHAQRGAPHAQNLLSQLGNNLGLGGLGGLGGLSGIGEKLSGLGAKLGIGQKDEAAAGEGEPGGATNLISSFLGENSPITKVLDALNIDNERLLLIGLLLILLNEKADKTLLIAIFYLLF